jgi:hypothetical protein
MSIVNGTFLLTCNKCGKQQKFAVEEADFEATSSSERQMGPENGYTWEHTFYCGECDNVIEIKYKVWEYPVGAFNYDKIQINGGTEVSLYGYDFHDAG